MWFRLAAPLIGACKPPTADKVSIREASMHPASVGACCRLHRRSYASNRTKQITHRAPVVVHSPLPLPATSTDMDTKPDIQHISDDAVPAVTEPGHGHAPSKLSVPPLVAAMSQEQRTHAEAKLRRKIDTRLLPMIILMYIMNYLDRNNIAAVRLAGLQDDLNLSSVQYQVGLFSRYTLKMRLVVHYVPTKERHF
jgi:hypothetical protein